MPAQFGSQRPTLTGEILHLGRKMRAISAQAMDEQELRRSCPADVEGQLDAVTREFHGSSNRLSPPTTIPTLAASSVALLRRGDTNDAVGILAPASNARPAPSRRSLMNRKLVLLLTRPVRSPLH